MLRDFRGSACDIFAGCVQELCLLGNVAKQVDARIECDAAAGRVTNLPESSQYLRGEYRAGWRL